MPEKDGILACLLVAEMMAARRAPSGEQLRDLFRRVGREYWPLRTNLDLPEDVKASAVARLGDEFATFLGRRVASTDRTDGLKIVFDDGAWILLRLSGTEPLMRIYTEAAARRGIRAPGRGRARLGVQRRGRRSKIMSERIAAEIVLEPARAAKFWAWRCWCWPSTTFSARTDFWPCAGRKRKWSSFAEISRGSIRKMARWPGR